MAEKPADQLRDEVVPRLIDDQRLEDHRVRPATRVEHQVVTVAVAAGELRGSRRLAGTVVQVTADRGNLSRILTLA
jgi:hypothetical protein